MLTRLANIFFSFAKPPRSPDVWEVNCAFSNKRHDWTCDGNSEVSQVQALILPSLHLCPAGVVVCKTVPFVQTTAILTGILTMTCIAIERYQGIVFPLKMRRHYSPKRAYKMLGTIYGAICSKAHSNHCCHQCHVNWHGVQSWQFASRRASVDCLCPGRLTDAVCAAAGGRRQNNTTFLHVSILPNQNYWKIFTQSRTSVRYYMSVRPQNTWGEKQNQKKTEIRLD